MYGPGELLRCRVPARRPLLGFTEFVPEPDQTFAYLEIVLSIDGAPTEQGCDRSGADLEVGALIA